MAPLLPDPPAALTIFGQALDHLHGRLEPGGVQRAGLGHGLGLSPPPARLPGRVRRGRLGSAQRPRRSRLHGSGAGRRRPYPAAAPAPFPASAPAPRPPLRRGQHSPASASDRPRPAPPPGPALSPPRPPPRPQAPMLRLPQRLPALLSSRTAPRPRGHAGKRSFFLSPSSSCPLSSLLVLLQYRKMKNSKRAIIHLFYGTRLTSGHLAPGSLLCCCLPSSQPSSYPHLVPHNSPKLPL